MSYLLGGSAGESSAFEKTIANSAIEVLHESQGLVALSNVVAPNQGNTYKQPSMAPVSFGDYDEAAGTGTGVGEQTVTLTSKEIIAAAAVAQSGFGKFIGWTTAYDLAANIGSEIGMSFAEKVDQRVAGAFAGFKATTGNTDYSAAYGDGFARVAAVGAQELIAAAGTIHANSVATQTSKTVLGLVRNVVRAWRLSRNPGRPTIILGPDEESRLLAELTVQTSANDLSALGNELQSTGTIRNVYGAQLVFTTFLGSASRAVNQAGAATVMIGAAVGPQALTTVMNQGLSITMGDQPGGLKTWVTGLGYFGSGVASTARGMAINIAAV
jgi:hypothetical protein